jgi:hypothetical protein
MAFVTPRMSLRVWNTPQDIFDHAQLAQNFLKLDQHNHTPGQGTQIPTDGIEDGAVISSKLATNLQVSPLDNSVSTVKIQNQAVNEDKIADGAVATAKLEDGAVTGDKVDSDFAKAAGISSSSIRRAGSFVGGTTTLSGSSTNVLTNLGDQVQVYLESNGLIFVQYWASWSCALTGGGRAAIHLNNNQLKIFNPEGSDGGNPVTQAASMDNGSAQLLANKVTPITTCAYGLISSTTQPSANAYQGDVATGQALGMLGQGASNFYGMALAGSVSAQAATPGPCAIFAAPGTYTVSVRFRSTNPNTNLTVKDRRLLVWTRA